MKKDIERDTSHQNKNETKQTNERFVTFGLKTDALSPEKRKRLLDEAEKMFEEDFDEQLLLPCPLT